MPWIDPDFPKTATPSDLVGRVLGLNPGMMTGPGTNTYLVGRRDPILIDTGAGVPDYVPLLERYLTERGFTQPSRVLLTHRHRDHLGGVASLRARFKGLRVSKMRHKDTDLPEPIEDLRAGETVPGDGVTLVPVYTPGHASDHLCYYLAEERALFTDGGRRRRGGLQLRERLALESADRVAERRSKRRRRRLPLQAPEVLDHLVEAVALDQVVGQQERQVVGLDGALALMAQREVARRPERAEVEAAVR